MAEVRAQPEVQECLPAFVRYAGTRSGLDLAILMLRREVQL
jgi:hypothetical protein